MRKSFIDWKTMKAEFLRDKRTKSTRATYGHALKTYRTALRGIDKNLDPILGEFRDVRDGIKLWMWESATFVTDSTLECRLRAVQSFYKWLSNESYIEKNPAAGIVFKRRAPKKPMEFPDTELADRFLEFLERNSQSEKVTDARDYLLVSILRDSGLRVSEVGALAVQDVDCATGKVHVRNGKGGKARITAISMATCALVAKFIETHNLLPDEYLFTPQWTYSWVPQIRIENAKPLKRTTIFQILQSRAKAFGFSDKEVKLLQSPHGYRHLWALEHVRANTNTIVLTKMAGWASPNMIMVYIESAGLDVHAVRR